MSEGFKRHGLDLRVTSDIGIESDIHIVSGPHYAKSYWLGHSSVLLIDRSYYNQHKSGKWASEDYVSIGWMNKYGGRDFQLGQWGRVPYGSKKLEIVNNHLPGGTIFLCDYGYKPTKQDLLGVDTIRYHPTQEHRQGSLTTDLYYHSTAVGYRTTALVQAGLQGLDIVCKDVQNIMHYDNWMDRLPWADWHYSEIQKGEAWEHLRR